MPTDYFSEYLPNYLDSEQEELSQLIEKVRQILCDELYNNSNFQDPIFDSIWSTTRIDSICDTGMKKPRKQAFFE